MKHNFKKVLAALSATVLGALPMANSLTANAATKYDDVKIIFGDVDSDGKVTDADAKKLARFLAEDRNVSFTSEERRRGDVNGDGKITTDDTIMILRFVNDFAKKDIYGDADGNGKVNINDAIMIEQFINRGRYKGEINLMAADVNADGVVNTFDHVLIARYDMDRLPSSLYINWGDVNSDGKITIQDAVRLSRYVAGTASLTRAEKRRADITLDGDISQEDIDALKTRIAYGYFIWK